MCERDSVGCKQRANNAASGISVASFFDSVIMKLEYLLLKCFMQNPCSPSEPQCCVFPPMNPALAALEAAKLAPSPVEALEARLTTLRDGVVDTPTAEAAVERTQVRGAERRGSAGLGERRTLSC